MPKGVYKRKPRQIELSVVLGVIDAHLYRRLSIIRFCAGEQIRNGKDYGRTEEEGRKFLRGRMDREIAARDVLKQVRDDVRHVRKGDA